ncbi:MAG TPA: DUF1993 domain-containing protein [Caulobacteraceae bacterium]|nr:DUF1993 domain-containing protein [Caulobacteraceae bacterium]
MAVSLYDCTVANFLQMLTGVEGFLAKGLEHFKANGPDPADIVQTRLWPDMLPFSFQIWSVKHHSLGAIEGVKAGVFSPPPELPDLDYAGWQKVVADAKQGLSALSRDEVEALAGKDVSFKFRDFNLPFTAENFLLSFSFPNFYFHATTAYDILRSKGAPLGKRDFTGPLRMKR